MSSLFRLTYAMIPFFISKVFCVYHDFQVTSKYTFNLSKAKSMILAFFPISSIPIKSLDVHLSMIRLYIQLYVHFSSFPSSFIFLMLEYDVSGKNEV